MKKLLSICFGVLLVSSSSLAQDVHFSQFNQTPQLINPGATGVFNGSIRGILNYRTQWSAFGNAFKTYGASFDAPITKKNKKGSFIGLGANFYKDVAGKSEFGNLQVGLSFSGVLAIARNQTVSLGIQTAYGQYSAKLNALSWGNQFNGERFDPRVNSNERFGLLSSRYFDLGTGIYYEFKNSKTAFLGSDLSSFNFGIAGYHLNKPKQTFLNNSEDVLPVKIVAQFSGTFDLSDSKISLVPSVFYAKQSSFKEITPGLLFKLRFGNSTKYSGMFKQGAIYFGSHYRLSDAIIPQVYLEFSDFMLGVSYDYNISETSNVTGGNGGFEISIKYVNKPKALQKSSF
ncbi:MAG: PorP/SprF family type IX secretion system membrane protein [Vicingaceae bacterium]